MKRNAKQMKNRPKPGTTRSYAANGGNVIKSDSPKDSHKDEVVPQPNPELEASKEVRATIEAELVAAKAELDKAVADNTKLTKKVTVLKGEAKGQAQVISGLEEELEGAIEAVEKSDD